MNPQFIKRLMGNLRSEKLIPSVPWCEARRAHVN
jgi:hypothetical protein